MTNIMVAPRTKGLWSCCQQAVTVLASDRKVTCVKADALRGHLDALLLATLDGRDLHGYAIIEALQKRSGGALDLPTGTVYPALRRLERAGFVQSSWNTVGGRQRRTYRLTQAGVRELQVQRRAWREFTSAIEGVLKAAPAQA
ncbi:helix-turn-helix transcriptional regulator, partial [Klebsiella pneumoniae]|nr:helix-turn-helix transcriptional regulator [Klebsiella pneumoniae]